MENLVIYDFSLAQTTALIGVNTCLRKSKLKKQSQLSRIEYCVIRIAKRNLKKQSQFKTGQMGVSAYVISEYEELTRLWAAKNKAKQSQ